MRKGLTLISMVGVLAVTSCNPTCNDAGNRIKKFTADANTMVEPATRTKEKPKEAEDAVGWEKVKPAQIEHYKLKYTLDSGTKIYIDEKKGMARAVYLDGKLVVEGKIGKFPDEQILIVIDDPKRDYELGFRKDGFMAFIPKLDTEKIISR